ncbi:MAG: DHH family phosphoesterase [Myxococcota bacterium]|nr:DHH family phosphoesterase [Myxococcota bacterium]
MSTLQPALLERFSELVRAEGRVLLTGPQDADGDSLGASLALARVLRTHWGVEVDVAGVASPAYAWLPDTDQLVADDVVKPVYSMVVVMDGDRHRLAPAVEQAFEQASTKAIVDHHRTTVSEGYDIALIDAESPATCQMVLEMLDAWSLCLDTAAATLLYAGILFDTGGFRYSNTRPETHIAASRLLALGIPHADIAVRVLMERTRGGMRLAAAIQDGTEFKVSGQLALGACTPALMARVGAEAHDLGGVVESLLYIEGVEVSALLVHKGDERTKLSFRSRGRVDVARLAKELDPGGGGHAKAAGVVVNQSIERLKERLPELIAARLQSGS